VGPAIRTSLLKTLGSARRIRETSVAELAAVPKVTPKLAQRIFDHFHPPAGEPRSTTDCYNAESLPAQEGGDST
jgi:ERCC4-type nuclease